MEWRHESSAEWFQARRKYLTATEIISLIPEYKRVCQGQLTELPLQFFKLYLRKTAPIQEEQTMNFGAAARGNELEPFGIGTYNNWADAKIQKEFYHHNDKLIFNPRELIAWSPDAIDIVLPFGVEHSCDDQKPESMLEHKGYDVVEHVNHYFKDKMKNDDRLQLAAAMACSASLMEGVLVYFNPNVVKLKMYEKYYERTELAEEISHCLGVRRVYNDMLKLLEDFEFDSFEEVPFTELDVWEAQAWLAPEQVDALANVFDVRGY